MLSGLGIAAGAGVASYLASRADYRAQDESDAKTLESDRVEKGRKEDDAINKKIYDKVQKRVAEREALLVKPVAAIAGTAPQQNINADNGDAASGAPAQQNIVAPLSHTTPTAPAGGIGQPEKKPPAPNRDDAIFAAGMKGDEYAAIGDFKKAGEAWTYQAGFKMLKVNEETVARGALIDDAQAKFLAGDYSGIRLVTGMVPIDRDVSEVKKNQDGSYTFFVTGKDGKSLEPFTLPDAKAVIDRLEVFRNGGNIAKMMADENTAKIKGLNDEAERKHKQQTGDAAMINANANKTTANAKNTKDNQTDLMKNTAYIQATIPGIDSREALAIAQGKSDKFSAAQPDIFGNTVVTNNATGETWKIGEKGQVVGVSGPKGGVKPLPAKPVIEKKSNYQSLYQ